MATSYVTDRTESDVEALRALQRKGVAGMTAAELTAFNSGGHKGGYDYTDYNRIGTTINALANRLNVCGFNLSVTAREDWTEEESPNDTARTALLADTAAIKATLGSIWSLPSAIPTVTYEEANAIELMLQEIERKIIRMTAGSFFCGEIVSGEF